MGFAAKAFVNLILAKKKEERANLEKQYIIDTTKEAMDAGTDIVDIALHNIDLLIEIKEALDSAP